MTVADWLSCYDGVRSFETSKIPSSLTVLEHWKKEPDFKTKEIVQSPSFTDQESDCFILKPLSLSDFILNQNAGLLFFLLLPGLFV